MSHRYDFASDNTAPAMPEVVDAVMRFNTGFCAGYGDDEVCEKAADLLRELLDTDARSLLHRFGQQRLTLRRWPPWLSRTRQ